MRHFPIYLVNLKGEKKFMKRFVLLLGIFLTSCMPAVQESSVALPQILPSATAYIDESYPSAEVAVAAPEQAAGGIDVRMERVSLEGKNLNADVCFTLPDASDWGIWSASLTFGEVVLQEYGTTLVSLQEPLEGQAGVRCDTLTFVVAPDADLTNAEIVIHSIGATPREDDYCTIYMPKIQHALINRGVGIVLDCVDVNGMLTMEIVSIPPEMTREQAEEMVYSEEFFTLNGPWSFPFSLSQ
jgi:hypothetical protein